MAVDRRTKPSIRNPELVLAFGRALEAKGYNFEGVRRLLGADDRLDTPRERLGLVSQHLGDGALAHLIRLFFMGAPITVEQAAKAMAPLSVQDGVALGVLSVGRSRVHGGVRITPIDGVFASDWDHDEDVHADHVMGVADSSRLLAALTFRTPVGMAVDIGTGCGYHAVLAARHSEKVIATDVNRRALDFAEFNALLNGVTNVECRMGDRFTPVKDEKFDLIVTNPPFVISPDRTYVYRDAGMGADRISREIVEEAPSFLNPGGSIHILMSWVHDPQGDWSEPLQQWVAASGCDAWFVREGSYSPLQYAVMWNQRLALNNLVSGYNAALERWVTYFNNAGIRCLAYGAAILRQRDGGGRVRADDLPEGGLRWPVGDDLQRIIALEDRLEALSPAELEQQVPLFTPEHHLDQKLRWSDGGFKVVDATLVREVGLRPTAEIDQPLAALLGQIDGVRTLAEVLETTGRLIGIPEGDSTAAFRAGATGVLRQMISYGFLTLRD